MKNTDRKLGLSTIPIHMGTEGKDSQHHPINAPIYASSTYAFPTVDHGARIFSGDDTNGFAYSRLGNPTTVDAETRLANLEGADDCAFFSSGMAAVTTLITSFVKSGDHIIADQTLYGGTHSFFTHNLPTMNVEITLVDASEPDNIRKAIKENTKMIYFESPTNPTMGMVPIKPIVEIAQDHGILTAIDATFMSPIFLRPLELGIDLSLHSVTKYINGHSDVIGGAISARQELIDVLKMQRIHLGGIMGPFDAYLVSRGMKTLKIRMDVLEKNGKIVADFLKSHCMIKWISYLGHKDNPGHQIAKEQQLGFGPMMAFEIDGGLEIAKIFVNGLDIITRAVSLGGVESLISHPASTTHSDLVVSSENRIKAGITDGLFRLSVGIEDVEDIIYDLEQAFELIKKSEIIAD